MSKEVNKRFPRKAPELKVSPKGKICYFVVFETLGTTPGHFAAITGIGDTQLGIAVVLAEILRACYH